MDILVIAPHADDEVLGVGGTISKYIAEGHQVYICVVTVGKESMFTSEVLNALRLETKVSHRFLGIKKTYFLEFPAVALNEVPKEILNNRISEIIMKVRPDVVFIPHFGDMHLDHAIVSQATMVCVRPINESKVQAIYSYETLSETEWNIPHVGLSFIPNTYVDISAYLNNKLEAMSCYATQVREFPHPRSIEAIKALAKLRGSVINVHAAEAFCLLRRIIR